MEIWIRLIVGQNFKLRCRCFATFFCSILRWCGVYFFLRCCGVDSPPMSPSLLYHKPLRNCNTFLPSNFLNRKSKQTCYMPSNIVFQYSKIRTRKRSVKKSTKTGKKWTPALFGIRNPESGIHSTESRIQECPGFPYTGRYSNDNTKCYPKQCIGM